LYLGGEDEASGEPNGHDVSGAGEEIIHHITHHLTLVSPIPHGVYIVSAWYHCLCSIVASQDGETLVGDTFHRGISGGQKRRLTIAVEIIDLPDVIFLDEPTTGLDSATALEVMWALRNLCNRQRVVVATIHQPPVEVYALFDRLTLLSQGSLVYHGKANDAIPFLSGVVSSVGMISSIGTPDDYHNPAEYVIKVAVLLPASALASAYRSSHLKSQAIVPSDAVMIGGKQHDHYHQPRRLLSQIAILNARHFKKISQDYRALFINNLNYCCLGAFWSWLYYQAGTTKEPQVAIPFFPLSLMPTDHSVRAPLSV